MDTIDTSGKKPLGAAKDPQDQLLKYLKQSVKYKVLFKIGPGLWKEVPPDPPKGMVDVNALTDWLLVNAQRSGDYLLAIFITDSLYVDRDDSDLVDQLNMGRY